MAEDKFVLKGKIVIDGIEGGGDVSGSPGVGAPPNVAPSQQGEEEEKKERKRIVAQRESLSARKISERETGGESQLAKTLSGSLQKIQRNQLVSGLGSLVSSPGASFSASGLAGGLAGQGLTSLVPAITGAIGGPLASTIASAMTAPLNSFIQRFFAEQKQIESQAGAAVSSKVGKFAAAGIGVSDEEINTLFELERARAQRGIDAMKQVARIQDTSNNSIEGILSSTFRRTVDALIG